MYCISQVPKGSRSEIPQYTLPGRWTTSAGTSSAVCGARKTKRFEDQGLASSAAVATGPGPMGTDLTASGATAGVVDDAGSVVVTLPTIVASFAEVEWLCQNNPRPISSTVATATAITTRESAKMFLAGPCWWLELSGAGGAGAGRTRAGLPVTPGMVGSCGLKGSTCLGSSAMLV